MPDPGSRLTGILLFIISCGCMFVLGIMVGRNTAPVHFEMENLDEKLTQLQSSVLTEEADPGNAEPAVPREIPIEFYDKLREESSDEEEAVSTGRSADDHAPVKEPKYHKDENVPTAVTVAELKKDSAAEKRPAEKASSRESSRNPAAANGEATSVSGYAIQVASLRDPERAESVRAKFRDKGYPAYTRQARVEGKGQWWRVRVGPYSSKEQAGNDLARLQKAGVDAIILPVTDETD